MAELYRFVLVIYQKHRMATVMITGGTGMIGTALSKALIEKNHEVIILSRHKSQKTEKVPGASIALWDIEKQEIDLNALASCDYIVHLAGEGVADKRWTKKRKKQIVESRVKSSSFLVNALKEHNNKVKGFISASGIGWYGNDPVIPNPRPFTEELPAAHDFIAETCRQWEESVAPVKQLGKRLVIIRTGVVLSREGGAIKKFLQPLAFSFATILGSGKQVISWIHIDDLVRMYISAIENESMESVYNAVSPFPVTNKELITELAHIKKGKLFIPVHVPALFIKTVYGELSVEVLKSTTVSSRRIREAGFTFNLPTIETALAQV